MKIGFLLGFLGDKIPLLQNKDNSGEVFFQYDAVASVCYV